MRTQQAQACQSCGIELIPGRMICPNCKQHYFSPPGTVAASWGIRLGAYLLDVVIAVITLLIGWIIWALFTFRNGQTPGKALLGIKAMRISGEPPTWGFTFIREVLVKFLVMGFLSNITFGISWLLDHLWPLWDDNLQALHDKIIGSIVVKQGVQTQAYQPAAAARAADPWRTGGEQPPTA